MENTEQIKYKYTCKYCKKVYNEPIKECNACGSSDFIETTYRVTDKKKKTLWIILLIFLIIIAAGILIKAIFADFISEDILSEFTIKEYSYDSSLLTDPEMYLGKKSDTSSADYYRIIKVTGTYHELCDNIFRNIYTTQLQRFLFSIPCDAEIKDGDFHMEITALNFGYYGGNYGYVDLSGSFSGSTDREISLYLIDENGNKDKMLLEDYHRDDYSSVAEFLCSDEVRKDFNITAALTEYKTFLVEYGETSYEYEINYDRASGSIEYYALKNK